MELDIPSLGVTPPRNVKDILQMLLHALILQVVTIPQFRVPPRRRLLSVRLESAYGVPPPFSAPDSLLAAGRLLVRVLIPGSPSAPAALPRVMSIIVFGISS